MNNSTKQQSITFSQGQGAKKTLLKLKSSTIIDSQVHVETATGVRLIVDRQSSKMIEDEDVQNPFREAVIAFLSNCPKNRLPKREYQDSFSHYRCKPGLAEPKEQLEQSPCQTEPTNIIVESDFIKHDRHNDSLAVFQAPSIDEKKAAFMEKNLLALEIERKASVQKANCLRRIRINKHLNTLRYCATLPFLET